MTGCINVWRPAFEDLDLDHVAGPTRQNVGQGCAKAPRPSRATTTGLRSAVTTRESSAPAGLPTSCHAALHMAVAKFHRHSAIRFGAR